MTNATAKPSSYGEFQSTTFKTRVAHMEIKEIKGADTLVLKLAHRLGADNEIRLVVFNSNGLMTAYANGNLIVGQELTVSGAIRSIRSHYSNAEGELVALKHPELIFNVRDFDFGAKPKAYEEAQITANPMALAENSHAQEEPAPAVRKAPAVIRRISTTSEQVQQRFGRIAEIQEAIGEVIDHEELVAA